MREVEEQKADRETMTMGGRNDGNDGDGMNGRSRTNDYARRLIGEIWALYGLCCEHNDHWMDNGRPDLVTAGILSALHECFISDDIRKSLMSYRSEMREKTAEAGLALRPFLEGILSLMDRLCQTHGNRSRARTQDKRKRHRSDGGSDAYNKA